MNDDNFDDGLVHSHGWATEPAMSPAQHGLKAPPQAASIPTPSTAYHDDKIELS